MEDKDFIDSIPRQRRLEIDAMVKSLEDEINEKGFEGLMKDSMSLEEFTEHIRNWEKNSSG